MPGGLGSGAVIDLMLFGFGAMIGSFLNVCIYRLPRHESVMLPASHCPHCRRRIRPWENIPILSFLLLRGRCAGCRQRISWRYPVVELMAGMLLVLLFHWYGWRWTFARHAMLLLLLIPITFIDLQHRLILNKITYPGMLIGLLLSLLESPQQFWQPVTGLVAGGGALLLIGWAGQKVFKQESMGGGDVKLAAMIGAYLGAPRTLAVLFLAFVIAAVISLVGMALGKLHRRSTIPFGPFIALATVTFISFGDQIVSFYRWLLR
jgi:leader peptidase (prepilin peptidase)/N-methyltransferase